MTTPTRTRLAALGAALLLTAGTGGAQEGSEPSAAERTALERLALARARTLLYDALRALPLRDGLTIGAWAAQSAELDRALRSWARAAPRFAAPRFYSDGSCDVDVRLTPEDLRDRLLDLQSRFQARQAEPADLRAAARAWPTLWRTGTAVHVEARSADRPLGWENVSFEGVQLAQRAARVDACAALLEEAGRLKVTHARFLSEFLDSGANVRDAVLSAAERAARITVQLDPDQVAVASASLSTPELIRILSEAHAAEYRGDLFHAADFREMALLNAQTELRATGLGVPPDSSLLRPAYEPIELDTPEWAERALSAVGRCEPRDEEGPLPPAVMLELARIDGMSALRRQIEALVIQKDVTVERFLAHRHELKRDVVTFLTGVRVVGPPRELPDGTLEVPVELPLRRLWEIIRGGMTVVEVDPPGGAAP